MKWYLSCACVRVLLSNCMSIDMPYEMVPLVSGPWGPGLICSTPRHPKACARVGLGRYGFLWTRGA
jgi:hypothetical protein